MKNAQYKEKANNAFKAWRELTGENAAAFKVLCAQVLILWNYNPQLAHEGRWCEAAWAVFENENYVEERGECNPTASALAPDDCERCGGAGNIKAFSHYAGGECFECGGYGKKENLDLI